LTDKFFVSKKSLTTDLNLFVGHNFESREIRFGPNSFRHSPEKVDAGFDELSLVLFTEFAIFSTSQVSLEQLNLQLELLVLEGDELVVGQQA
jgi:hypothetical protein